VSTADTHTEGKTFPGKQQQLLNDQQHRDTESRPGQLNQSSGEAAALPVMHLPRHRDTAGTWDLTSGGLGRSRGTAGTQNLVPDSASATTTCTRL
jgi:hypothetical protein